MSELLDFLRTHDEAFRSRARLASLYSDFRQQRTTNPDGYRANSSAWLRALSSAAKAGLIPSQTGEAGGSSRFVMESGENLLRELNTQQYGRPLALGAVLEDAMNSKALIPLREFLDRKDSLYHKSWIPTPWQVVTWGLRQLGVIGGTSSEDKLVKGNFVVVANVEAAAKVVQEQAGKIMTSDSERIFTRELFDTTFARTLGVNALSPNDLNVLLRHLSRDRNAGAYDAESGTVKFAAPGEATPSPVTKEDISIASLRTLIASLQPQIDHLTNRISTLDATARSAVAEKQLLKAKTALRQKKAATTKLEQRTATLAQLEDVYAKIEQAADQVQIVRVLEQGGQALKSLNAQTGGVEKVQDVMEGLREDMMDTEDMSNAINEVAMGEVDEGEVEDELEALEKVEKDKIEAKERAEREAKEELEAEAREKREAEEAEETRARLTELESVAKVPDGQVDAQMKDAEQEAA
ncbi:putative Snf7 family protein [Septoria linicola]|nr:putative Snf7 family protein [Septoria linicola]